jgi:propionyl-CoA carboxylase alpha chain
MKLHGPVTNRDSLVAILRSAAFLAGDTTTSFLDEHPSVLEPITCAEDQQRHAIAVAYVLAVLDAPEERVPLGWRNVPAAQEFVTLARRGRAGYLTVLVDRRRDHDRVRLARTTDVPYGGVFATDADDVPSARVRIERSSSAVVAVVEVEGIAARCEVARYGDEVFVDDGLHSSAWMVEPRFADHSGDAAGHGAVTPVPGTITAVSVAAGDPVAAGQLLVVLEAMKMEHRILADVDGVVARVLVEVGQSVDAHALVVEFEEPGIDAEAIP